MGKQSEWKTALKEKYGIMASISLKFFFALFFFMPSRTRRLKGTRGKRLEQRKIVAGRLGLDESALSKGASKRLRGEIATYRKKARSEKEFERERRQEEKRRAGEKFKKIQKALWHDIFDYLKRYRVYHKSAACAFMFDAYGFLSKGIDNRKFTGDLHKDFLMLFKENKVRDVLEVGPGPSGVLLPLRPLFEEAGVRVHAIDVRGPKKAVPGVDWRLGDARETGKVFGGKKFDVIFIKGVLDRGGARPGYGGEDNDRRLIRRGHNIMKSLIKSMSKNPKAFCYAAGIDARMKVRRKWLKKSADIVKEDTGMGLMDYPALDFAKAGAEKGGMKKRYDYKAMKDYPFMVMLTKKRKRKQGS